MSIGYGSLFIVLLVAGFAGAVTSLQAGYQFTGSVPLYVYGAVVVESIILELGPVLTGLILAGRIGARYAAELGTDARHRADRRAREPRALAGEPPDHPAGRWRGWS